LQRIVATGPAHEAFFAPRGGGGGGSSGGTGGGSSGGGNNNGGGSSGGNNGTGNNTPTIKPHIGINVKPFTLTTKPCESLKEFTNDPNIKASLVDLRDNKLGATPYREHGYSYSKEPNGSTTTTALPPGSVGSSTIGIPAGGTKYSASHTHPDDGLTMPMFSPEDIIVLYTLLKHYNYNSTNGTQNQMLSSFTYTVTTINGTYAMKIDNTLFYGFMSSIMNDTKKKNQFISELKTLQKNKNTTDSASGFEKDFLNFVSKYNLNISLYKANQDFTNWNKLSVNPTNPNNITSTPCQ
jgi:hypothetical protein